MQTAADDRHLLNIVFTVSCIENWKSTSKTSSFCGYPATGLHTRHMGTKGKVCKVRKLRLKWYLILKCYVCYQISQGKKKESY